MKFLDKQEHQIKNNAKKRIFALIDEKEKIKEMENQYYDKKLEAKADSASKDAK